MVSPHLPILKHDNIPPPRRNDKKNYFIILNVFFLITCALAQSNQLEPKQWLSISDGLAHNGVTSILEDSKGYLWVGTYDGLNRYDGYEIKVFKNKVREKIFVSNRIRTIAEDSNNNLWIGTDEGISIYNRNQESFSNLYSNKLTNKKLKGPVVRQILFNHKNKLSICATEGYGLLVFNQDYTLDNQYLPQNDVPERPISFLNGLALDEQHYLFTTSAGLLLFNIETKEFTKILAEDINRANSRFNNSSILKMAKNELLVTLSNGLALINYTKNETGYTFQLKNTRLDSYNINSAAIDSLGQLWLGDLTNGFLRIDDVAAFRNNQAFETATFRANTDLLRSSCIIPTSVGCWLGTFNKGLYLFDWKENPFKFYHTGMKKEYGLQSNQILSISPIDSHQVYMTANRGGVALFNTQKQTFSPLPFALAAETQLGVPRISVDAQKDIWLKQGRGSYLLHFKGDNTIQENITEKFPFLKNTTIRTIVDDKTGNVWLGTIEGLFKIQLDENREVLNVETINDHPFFASNPMSNVRHIYVDPAFDFIWIGTKSDGLFRINTQASQSLADAKIEQYVNDENAPSSISSNFVTASIRLPNNTFWISTEGGGICQVLNSDTQPSFKTFSEADGLSNNVVKGMLYDGQNHLWISTNIGLNRFDTETFQLRSYSKADGLPFEAFDYACAKLDNGLMLFSGLEGLCYFNPNELKEDTHLPTLDFEGLKVLNVPVTPGELVNDRILLSQSLANTDVLHLNHNENVFSIKLKSLGFSKSKNYRLQHRLLPINENWIETPSDQQEIFYNGLPPKQYTLQVRASNALNEWTAPKALTIKINPPFWKTKWAYLSYVILSLWLIAMVVFAVLRIQSLNHNLEIEKLEKSNIKEINASKLRLFSNISHEIKTPITLISGPVSLLIDRFRGNLPIQEKLELIQRQSNKIAALVDQVHDFQKSDAQALKLKKTHFNFNAFVEELIKDFEFMAKSDQRKFKVKRPETTTYVLADKNKLEKIINNLLNNAFKYTQQGDTIQLTYSSDDKDLVITVTDTGIGMSQEDLPYIFKRFYQAKNHHPDIGGTGIGLAFSKRLVDMHFGFITVESELHQGSTFTVQLPIVNPAPTALEIEKEKALLSLEKKSLPIDLIDRKVELSNIQLKDDFSEQQIFLVEDNVELRTFTSEVLSKFFKVMTFSNGKECLDKMEKVWPDIIVSDIMMPEVNGLELCRQIKSEVKTSHIPVILLTARTTVDDQIQGLKDGADAYIKKPFDVQHLIIKIAALLDSRKQLRERFQIDNPIALDKTREHNNDTIFLEKLYALIAENLDNQDLDIDSFAKKLYLNRTHFYQKVKALTNETPYELMKAYRLKQAAAILVQQNLSVTEVYVMTGFKSRTHFSKLFKEKYGISPGKYAKSQ